MAKKKLQQEREVNEVETASIEAVGVNPTSEEIDSMMNEIEPEKVEDHRQRIAVFTKNWMESTLLAAGLPNRCHKSWKSMQVVFCKEDIDRLISLNAPIRVFVEDGTY